MLTGDGRNAIISILTGMMILCVSAVPAQAQGPIPIFTIWGDEDMAECDFHPLGPYQAFNVYVFLTPSDDGAFAAEYKLVNIPSHFMIANEPAPFVSGATTGTPFGAPGISAGFLSCQTVTVWVWTVTCMSPDIERGYYFLDLHDDTQFLGVALCSGDRPMVDGIAGFYFGFNELGSCRFATEESSWGAIKGMYR